MVVLIQVHNRARLVNYRQSNYAGSSVEFPSLISLAARRQQNPCGMIVCMPRTYQHLYTLYFILYTCRQLSSFTFLHWTFFKNSILYGLGRIRSPNMI